MFAKRSKRIFSVFLALVIAFGAAELFGVSEIKASAASWNGTNYGGGEMYGSRTFLEAFGIDYNVYMNWMDQHDEDDYYNGTRYIGYDHRNPHGDHSGAYGTYDTPGVEGMNCTGFVWHILYKSAKLSGASQSQINSLPVMGAVPSTWASKGVYRIYFRTKEEALASGVLEKGDLLWIYGTKDNHNAIFYGDYPSHDRFWHCAGTTEFAKIRSAGTFLGMWVAKVTKPDSIELHAGLSNRDSGADSDSSFGTKYCVFTDKNKASAAAAGDKSSAAWDSRIGTIVTDSKGYGCFRTAGAPKNNELRINGAAQKNLSYFSSAARKVSAKKTYYAVEWTPPVGSERDRTVYEFKDSGKRTSAGYRQYNIKPIKKVAAPKITKFESTSGGVKISWGAVSGARQYRVYRKAENGSWKKLRQTFSTSATDGSVSVGASYTYTVRCVDADGDFTSSYYKNGWSYTYAGIAVPQFGEIISTPDGIKMQWSAVSGASSYRLYRKNSSGKWAKLAETASTEFTDSDVALGKDYTYTIRCLNAKRVLVSDYVRSGWSCRYDGAAAPKITKAESVLSGIKLNWSKIEGVKTYRVFYKTQTGWKRLSDTASTTITDTDVTVGKSYTYTVRCVNSADKYSSSYDTKGVTVKYLG